MNHRLTDTELVLLVHASQHKDGVAWPHPPVQGDADKALNQLVNKRLLKRKKVPPIQKHWLKNRNGTFIPVITAAGCDELNLEKSQRPAL